MYRNVILTVIAACLLWICARDLVPSKQAEARQAFKPLPAPVRVHVASCDRNALKGAGPLNVITEPRFR